MEKTIEIPFGAKDSELKGWEYTIPEGMEARIEGNKVIIEPKESEDEKIRKELLAHIQQERASSTLKVNHAKWDKMIAWLEKQGSQNLANSEKTCKDEPKFKVGDWMVQEGVGTFKIIEICKSWYEVIDYTGNRYSIAFLLENGCHLWTIQDAKDGDVLHSTGLHNDCIFIFNGLDNWRFEEPNGDRAVATGYCSLSISADKMEFGIQGPDCVEVNTIKPATKEQRDLLFQKMKEAGYEWNAEKKELKKIEQKPVIEMKSAEESLGIDSKAYNKIVDECIYGEQNPAWSEDDEVKFRDVIRLVEQGAPVQSIRDHYTNWLKSLKERYTWKPSDEQMEYLAKAITTLGNEGDNKTSAILCELRADLKKLKG